MAAPAGESSSRPFAKGTKCRQGQGGRPTALAITRADGCARHGAWCWWVIPVAASMGSAASCCPPLLFPARSRISWPSTNRGEGPLGAHPHPAHPWPWHGKATRQGGWVGWERNGASCHRGEVVSGRTGQSARIQASLLSRALTPCLLMFGFLQPVRWLCPAALHLSWEYTQLSSVKPGFILLTRVASAEDAGARILQTATCLVTHKWFRGGTAGHCAVERTPVAGKRWHAGCGRGGVTVVPNISAQTCPSWLD